MKCSHNTTTLNANISAAACKCDSLMCIYNNTDVSMITDIANIQVLVLAEMSLFRWQNGWKPNVYAPFWRWEQQHKNPSSSRKQRLKFKFLSPLNVVVETKEWRLIHRYVDTHIYCRCGWLCFSRANSFCYRSNSRVVLEISLTYCCCCFCML